MTEITLRPYQTFIDNVRAELIRLGNLTNFQYFALDFDLTTLKITHGDYAREADECVD